MANNAAIRSSTFEFVLKKHPERERALKCAHDLLWNYFGRDYTSAQLDDVSEIIHKHCCAPEYANHS